MPRRTSVPTATAFWKRVAAIEPATKPFTAMLASRASHGSSMMASGAGARRRRGRCGPDPAPGKAMRAPRPPPPRSTVTTPRLHPVPCPPSPCTRAACEMHRALTRGAAASSESSKRALLTGTAEWIRRRSLARQDGDSRGPPRRRAAQHCRKASCQITPPGPRCRCPGARGPFAYFVISHVRAQARN